MNSAPDFDGMLEASAGTADVASSIIGYCGTIVPGICKWEIPDNSFRKQLCSLHLFVPVAFVSRCVVVFD